MYFFDLSCVLILQFCLEEFLYTFLFLLRQLHIFCFSQLSFRFNLTQSSQELHIGRIVFEVEIFVFVALHERCDYRQESEFFDEWVDFNELLFRNIFSWIQFGLAIKIIHVDFRHLSNSFAKMN